MKLYVGNWVKHYGRGRRRGWIGQIVSVFAQCYTVRWVYGEGSKAIEGFYPAGWAEENLVVIPGDKVKNTTPIKPTPEEQYLVWSPRGKNNPQVVHDSYDSAKEEAVRLSGVNRGKEFFVCKLVGRAAETRNIKFEEINV